MPKTKQPAPRKPVKARGALPAPRVAPQRDTTPWYQRTRFRVLMALAGLVIIAVGVKMVLDARERAEERRRDVRSIEQFERRVQDLNLDIQAVYEQLSLAPGQFLAGVLPEADYRTQAESWIEDFRELNTGIRNAEVPDDLETLVEAKAHYVQATTIYIDAAKVFLSAAHIPDPAQREASTVLGRNLFLHAAAVYGMGDREIVRIKNEFDLNDPEAELPAPQLMEEEVPIPPPPPPAPGDPSTVAPPAPAPEAAPAPAPAASP